MNNLSQFPFAFNPSVPPPNVILNQFVAVKPCEKYDLLCNERKNFFESIRLALEDNHVGKSQANKSLINSKQIDEQNHNFKISDHHARTLESNEILKEANKKLEILKKQPNDQLLMKEIEHLNNNYQEINAKLNDQVYQRKLRKVIRKRKAKNHRIYLNRTKKRQNDELLNNEIECKHKEIDKNILYFNEKVLQEEEAKKTNAERNKILNKIYQNLKDVKQMQEILVNLRKLRNIRRKHAQDKNLYPRDYDPHEQEFEEKLREMEEHLQMIKIEYIKERQDLEKMHNHEETDKKTNVIVLSESKEALKRIEEEFKILFFDGNDNLAPTDQLFIEKQFYLQPHNSLSSLIQLRNGWDRYLNASTGSNVPMEWIYPSESNDKIWSKYVTNC